MRNIEEETVFNVRNVLKRHWMIEELVRKQNLVELQRLIEQLDSNAIVQILEDFSHDDRQTVWSMIEEERKADILNAISYKTRIDIIVDAKSNHIVRIFDLENGLLRQIPIETVDDLNDTKPVWVDLVMPNEKQLNWVNEIFGVDLPNPKNLTDLETSARFYIEDNGEVHLHSDFLLDNRSESRNVAVAFVLKKDILFSVRNDELLPFRCLHNRSEPNYIEDAKDLLLDLYAANIEYSADALENVYSKLENVGQKVFKSYMTDEEAEKILTVIAAEEDLNGRIRRNVLDSRRALSFLMRGKFLSHIQHETVREILRDIESLDGHTSFLFNKINFQLDATVGFVNVNQNKDIKRLTVISLVFMPLNVLADIGGMSEFSMMTEGIPWQISYSCFGVAMVIVGWVTFHCVHFFERHRTKKLSTQFSVTNGVKMPP